MRVHLHFEAAATTLVRMQVDFNYEAAAAAAIYNYIIPFNYTMIAAVSQAYFS